MSDSREIQNLLAMRDALVELSGALREWLFLQSSMEGSLTTKEVDELLKALGEKTLGNSKREPDSKN
jgi:predicted component of type VI protein secretion system